MPREIKMIKPTKFTYFSIFLFDFLLVIHSYKTKTILPPSKAGKGRIFINANDKLRIPVIFSKLLITFFPEDFTVSSMIAKMPIGPEKAWATVSAFFSLIAEENKLEITRRLYSIKL